MNALLLGLVAVLSSKEVVMNISADGKKLGVARFSQQLLPDGGKQVQILMDLSSDSKKGVRVRQESAYDAQGNPVRKIQEVTSGEGKRTQLALVTFDAEGAKMSLDEGGKHSEKKYPLTKGAPRADLSEFWLIRDKPKQNAKVTHFRFDVSGARWSLAESVYIGKTTVSVGGKTVSAHMIRSTDGVAYSDDVGDPLLIQTGNVKMERLR